MVRILFPPAVSQRTIIRRRPAAAAFALLANSRLLLAREYRTSSQFWLGFSFSYRLLLLIKAQQLGICGRLLDRNVDKF
jgi:hypothetical protein